MTLSANYSALSEIVAAQSNEKPNIFCILTTEPSRLLSKNILGKNLWARKCDDSKERVNEIK